VGPYVGTSTTTKDTHWHAAIAVNVCGTWQPGPIWPSYTSGGTLARKGTNVYAGMHTHTLQSGQSDGLIHMEPQVQSAAAKNATIGKWMSYGGWHTSGSSIDVWTGADGKAIKLENGDVCRSGPYKGRKSVVRWARGQHQDGKTTKLLEQHGDINHYKLYDGDV